MNTFIPIPALTLGNSRQTVTLIMISVMTDVCKVEVCLYLESNPDVYSRMFTFYSDGWKTVYQTGGDIKQCVYITALK
jgi:hypothetical protein